MIMRFKIFLLYITIRIFGFTWSFKLVNSERINPKTNKNQKIIFPFWHGRLLIPAFYYRNTDIHGIISRSADGELMTGLSTRLGYTIARGSSSKGGRQAFARLLRAMQGGHNIGLAPDGPRGPAQKVQIGVIQLAKLQGHRIVPLTFAATRFKRFKSWDGFILPLPFSRIVIIFGKVINVPRKCTDLEEKRKELEDEMNRITKEADDYFRKDSK
jgi:lysophospholipid acyltransferase (LPLAT)-like uncharacterized protein